MSVEVSEMNTLDRGSFSAWAATCRAARGGGVQNRDEGGELTRCGPSP